MTRNYHKQTRQATDVIRKDAGEAWPQSFLDLAGRFPDFPLRTEVDAGRDSGIPKPADQVFDRLEAKYAARAGARKR